MIRTKWVIIIKPKTAKNTLFAVVNSLKSIQVKVIAASTTSIVALV
ncbi:hypothetical protein [Lederbergia lenta]